MTIGIPTATVTAQPIAYSEDFNDGEAQGWQLDPNWQVRQKALASRGSGIARYSGAAWENLTLSFLFDTSGRGLQASIRVSDSGRYGAGFRTERGFLHVYLFKATGASGPHAFRDLGQRRIPLRTVQPLTRGEISVHNDTIALSVNGARVLSARDPQPHPAGTIFFESLGESRAAVDEIVVRAERSTVRVPSFIGKPLGEARAQIKELNLGAGQTKERPADIKQGLIVDQHPLEGERVASGTSVSLVVSAGPQQIEVPRLIGLKRREAIRAIREAGLKAGGLRQGDSARDDMPVEDQDPRPGTRVAGGATVTFTVAGKESVEVPRVMDRTLKMARDMIESSRLVAGEVARKASDAAPDTVVDQQPKPGARVPSGSAVQLWVSSGPAGAGVDDVEVPRLTGRKRSEAAAVLGQARLEVGKVYEKTSPGESETIVFQDPPPGARVRPRSAVDLWVSVPAGRVSVPDLVRQDVPRARSVLEAAGLRLGQVSELGSREQEGTVLDQFPAAGLQVEPGTAISVSVAGRGNEPGWLGCLLTALAAALLGGIGGYWGRGRFGNGQDKFKQPIDQITIRALKDPGSQTLESTGPIVGGPLLRCRVISDAGEQLMDIPGAVRGSDEDEHVG